MIETLTPDQYAEIIKINKPHLVEIEEHAQSLQYGKMVITLEVRAGVVNKMEFHETKTWLSPKVNKT